MPQVDRATIAPIRIPAVSVNLTLPWFTGKPYALYAHVRSVGTNGASAWSRPFGFDMRWEDMPVPMPADRASSAGAGPGGDLVPGLVPGHPQVVLDTHERRRPARVLPSTTTRTGTRRCSWRVRAVRHVLGQSPNGLPAVSYGPWSPVYSTTNPSFSSGKLDLRATVSDVSQHRLEGRSASAHAGPDVLRQRGPARAGVAALPPYAFTDRDCVNVVFRGSVVGGPAFAPRTGGPVKLPATSDELDLATRHGAAPEREDRGREDLMADGSEVVERVPSGRARGRARRPPGRRREDHALLLDGRAGGHQRQRQRNVHVRRRRPPAGRLRGRPRLDLRKALPPRNHALRRRLRRPA